MESSPRQQTACQIIHVDDSDEGMLVDLVTLEASTRGDRSVPAGTPLVLDFDVQPVSENWGLEALALLLLQRWEEDCALVDLVVDDDSAGRRYELTSGDEQIVFIVDDLPGDG